VRRVSSAATRSTSFRIRKARSVMSSRLPIGWKRCKVCLRVYSAYPCPIFLKECSVPMNTFYHNSIESGPAVQTPAGLRFYEFLFEFAICSLFFPAKPAFYFVRAYARSEVLRRKMGSSISGRCFRKSPRHPRAQSRLSPQKPILKGKGSNVNLSPCVI